MLSIACIAALAIAWSSPQSADRGKSPGREHPVILVLSAAAMRQPLEAAAADFEQETGIKVDIHPDASENLLTTLRVTQQGDLFVPADDSYVQRARQLGLVDGEYPIATLTTVAVFRSDFPKSAKDITWNDVLANGFRLAQPNPATAVGKRTREGLTSSGLWRRIEQAKPAMMGTVTQAINAVKLGSADAAIVWDGVAAQYPTLKVVHLPHLDEITANVTAAVCTNSVAQSESRLFAQYVAGKGQAHFAKAGYARPRRPKQ